MRSFGRRQFNALDHDPAALDQQHGGFRAAVHLELFKNVAEVDFYRMWTDDQLARNFGVAGAG